MTVGETKMGRKVYEDTDLESLEQAAKDAAHAKLKLAAEDLLETIDGCDPDDPVGSLEHLTQDLRDALGTLAVLDGDAEEVRPPGDYSDDGEDPEDPDKPPECDMCEGQGFGMDSEGAVACPQCQGTGTQPEEWDRI